MFNRSAGGFELNFTSDGPLAAHSSARPVRYNHLRYHWTGVILWEDAQNLLEQQNR